MNKRSFFIKVKHYKNLEIIHPLYQWEYENNIFYDLVTKLPMGKIAKRKLLAELKRRVEILS